MVLPPQRRCYFWPPLPGLARHSHPPKARMTLFRLRSNWWAEGKRGAVAVPVSTGCPLLCTPYSVILCTLLRSACGGPCPLEFCPLR